MSAIREPWLSATWISSGSISAQVLQCVAVISWTSRLRPPPSVNTGFSKSSDGSTITAWPLSVASIATVNSERNGERRIPIESCPVHTPPNKPLP